ncbi:MAG: TlpA family protein disulfide reductase [Bacteroidetes bacterium]|nr:TlpA family protein disulfide reductase [Bacteroidota bacterium]
MAFFFKIQLAFLLFPVFLLAQNVHVKGIAPTHKGKKIAVFLYDDLITQSQTEQDADTVDARGNFELSFSITQTQTALIRTDNLVGKLYVQPNYIYGVVFPERDSTRFIAGNNEQTINLIINGDSTELNARIIDFNECFNVFWEKNYKEFISNRASKKLDTFQLEINKRYEKVKSAYFKTYIKYTFASLNESLGKHRTYLAAHYLIGNPIAYSNFEYMTFFNQYFGQYAQKQSNTKNGSFIWGAINEVGDFKHVNELLKGDPALQNDSLRELAAIKTIYDAYFTPGFNKEKIREMLEQEQASTKIAIHKRICFNALRNINNMKVGQLAPNFLLKNIKNDTFSLHQFRKRYVYLNFFSSGCVDCLQELKKEEQLYKKYADKVVFISIATDKDTVDFKKFIKQNTAYKWLFLHTDNNKKTTEQYNIKSMPVYYLISPDGYLLQSPATKPSEGIEYKFDQIFKIHQKKISVGR